MSKLTLNNVGNLIDATTAATVINDNSAAIVAAMDNTLSRDGTTPNAMGSDLDMNGRQVLNLPVPATDNSPVRLKDVQDMIDGTGTITNIPAGGSTNQVLAKDSNNNYDISWHNSVQSVGLSLPNDFTVTGSPVTSTGTLTATWSSTPTGTGSIVRGYQPNIVQPTGIVKADVGLGNVDNTSDADKWASAATLTQKTIDTANNTLILRGTTAGGNAAAGVVGEYLEVSVLRGSPISMTTGTQTTVTTLALTPGDWDVFGSVGFSPTGATMTRVRGYFNTNSLDGNGSTMLTGSFPSSFDILLPMPTKRFNVTANTNVVLVGICDFTGGTVGVYGTVCARRVR